MIVVGVAAPDGLYVRQGDGFRKVEPTRESLVVQLTPDGLVRCRHCGEPVCDCQDWLEWMALAEPQEDSANAA